MSAPNGSAPEATGKKMSTVVGINFGNTYASIAVITKVRIFSLVLNKIAHLKIPSLKEGLADCIANEDGERQIACAISFQVEELVSIKSTSTLSISHLSLYSTSETKQNHSSLRMLKIR